ncbi:MAG: NifU family protein [Chlamydiia bacterium]|nr:NifU family protein [Chlamydiia bacterium]
MSLEELLAPFPWTLSSKKMRDKVLAPISVGRFTQEEGTAREMHVASGSEGFLEEGNTVTFYLLVDPEDGMIVDARFQAFGHSALLAAAESVCLLIVGKNYDQAKRINADLVDKQLRDKPDIPAFPIDSMGHLNLVLQALDRACDECTHIPLPEKYETPIPIGQGKGYPGWIDLSIGQKREVIEKIFDEEIRPYIELDAGGVELKEIKGDFEVVISYKGQCTSCFSAIGTTLSTIGQLLQIHVHPKLTVSPDLDSLIL